MKPLGRNGLALVGAIVSILALGPGCGVRVGNGLREIKSPMGFDLAVDERLNIEANLETRTMVIDNRKLLSAAEGEKKSELQLVVQPGTSLRSPQELYLVAMEEHYGMEFKPVVRPEGRGIVAEAQSEPGTIKRHYYWITNAGDLIRGNLLAYPNGLGTLTVPPAADSLIAR